MADIQNLIQTAAQPQEPLSPQPQPQQFDEGFDAPDAFGSAVGALAQLLQEDPTLAAKIADLIEQHYSGGEVMQPQEQPQPQVALEPQAQVSPELAQRLAALEQTIAQMQRPLADYQLDRELAQLRQNYGNYRKHYGDVLPENFDELEKPVLEKYQAILEGRIPPHELALRTALDEVLYSGDTPLRDRLLASVAQQAPQPPRVEGTGGMAAASTAEEQPTPRTTAERMARLKELYKTLLQNPGE